MTNNLRGQRLPSSLNSPEKTVLGVSLSGLRSPEFFFQLQFRRRNLRPTARPIRRQGTPSPATYSQHRFTITDSLFLTGSGASVTIIDGNKSLHPNSGVLSIGLTLNSEITVSISRVTIRNGSAGEDGGDLCAGL
jgi:hypothetical protein